MRFHAEVHTVGELLDALEGLDPSTPLVWEYDAPFGRGEVHRVKVEARPSVAFIDLRDGLDWW